MIRLFYVSTAAEFVTEAVVDEIITKSKNGNEARGITGALMLNGNVFGQILEGKEESVLALLDVIRSDDRHTGLVEVHRIEIEDRAYYDWGMKRLENSSFADFIAIMNE